MNSLGSADIVIAGAGPAGATASLFLCKYKVPHVVLDKSVFPRDKVCGDALSGKVTYVLKRIDSSIQRELASLTGSFLPCDGVLFSAPNGKTIEVPFSKSPESMKSPVAYIAKRYSFDDFLFRRIDRNIARVIEGAEIKTISRMDGGIEIGYSVKEEQSTLRCKLLIGAEGDRSATARSLAGYRLDRKHHTAAVRAYYRGVRGLQRQRFIELHYLTHILPGYFWIFPLPNGEANVGVGIPSHIISRKRLSLKNEMLRIIREHPGVRERFNEAEMIGEVKGWGLPLGSESRRISGDNFMLAGDAASLVDPFTGEGIGNAMLSGMEAARQAKRCIDAACFDERFMDRYDANVDRIVGSELRLSTRLQKLGRFGWLMNLLVNRANRNRTLRECLPLMFFDSEERKVLKDVRFLLKLVFKY